MDSVTVGSPATRNLRIFDKAIIPDPYPTYHYLRETSPVYWDETYQIFILTRYEDVAAALKDNRLSASRTEALMNRLPKENIAEFESFRKWFGLQFLFLDPPSHTRIRNLVAKTFTPRLIENLRPRIEANTLALIEAMKKKWPRGITARVCVSAAAICDWRSPRRPARRLDDAEKMVGGPGSFS